MSGQTLGGTNSRVIAARANLSGASLSIATSTFTAIDLTTSESFDDYNFHDPVTNPSRFTVPAGLDGFYSIIGYADFPTNSGGTRGIRLRKNGSTTLRDFLVAPAPDNSTRYQCVVDEFLAGGEYVELLVFQSSGVSLNLSAASLSLKAVL